MRMHDGEVDIDAELVGRLVAAQFPELTDLPIHELLSLRLGDLPVDRRSAYADELVDDGTWHRARGYALHQAALIIPYYAETNPGFVAPPRRTVEEVLADAQEAG
jgi:hypothetical protein